MMKRIVRGPRASFTIFRQTKQPHVGKWLRKWHQISESFEKRYRNDLPYWYSERTNIGFLGLAAHDLKGYPIQEYPTLKRKRKKGHGRADLYVRFPGGWSYDIEAKQAWPKINGKCVKSSTKGALERAEDDCRDMDKKARSGKGLAVAFVCPYGELNDIDIDHLNRFENQMKEVEKELVEKGSAPDFIAIHQVDFKHSKELTVEMPKIWREHGKRYWYPCVAIVGKVM
jgi:hypothetical protein